MVVVGAGSCLHLQVGEPLARTVLAPWWITHSAVKMECNLTKRGPGLYFCLSLWYTQTWEVYRGQIVKVLHYSWSQYQKFIQIRANLNSGPKLSRCQHLHYRVSHTGLIFFYLHHTCLDCFCIYPLPELLCRDSEFLQPPYSRDCALVC